MIEKEIASALMAVENRMHNPIFIAMDNIVISQNEIAVRSITKSPGRGPSSVFHILLKGILQGTLKALRSCRPRA